MGPESRFTEVDLRDGIETVNAGHDLGADEDEASSSTGRAGIMLTESTAYLTDNTHPDGLSMDSDRKHSQSSLQSSSSNTMSQSTLSGAGDGPLEQDKRETSPPAYQDVESQRRESDATTSTIATNTTQMTVGKQQTREERAAGKGFLSWLTRTRPPPPLPSERTVSPEYTAGIFSRLTFQWMSPIMSVSIVSSTVEVHLPRTRAPFSRTTIFLALGFISRMYQAAESLQRRIPHVE